MRKIAFIIYLSLCFTVSAFSSDAREDLPSSWSQALKIGIEKMIRKGINPDDSILMIRAMDQARYDEKLMLKAQNMVIDAHQKGLPTKPIMDKAFEGIAKHISPVLVVKAMERIADRYRYAFTLARQLVSQETEINHLGKILATGITAGLRLRDVETIVGELVNHVKKDKPLIQHPLAIETLLTVRDMARQGVSSKMAEQVVTQALQKGFSVGEMKSMHHTFMSRARQSSAEHIAKSFSKAIQQGKMSNISNMGKTGHGSTSGVTGSHGAEGGSGGSGSPGASGGSGDGEGGSGGAGGSGSGGSGGNGGSGGGSGGSGGGSGGSGGGSGGSGGGT